VAVIVASEARYPLSNRCEVKSEGSVLTARIAPERSVGSLILTPLIFAVVTKTVFELRWAGFVLWIMLLWLAWRLLWSWLGSEKIDADVSSFRITSEVLGLHRTRRFESQDVEWIAYHPRAYRSAAGIGLLRKNTGMPVEFGRELEPAEAECLLQALKHIGGGLADKVRGITETSYYRPN
jgi:hypothetical protein